MINLSKTVIAVICLLGVLGNVQAQNINDAIIADATAKSEIATFSDVQLSKNTFFVEVGGQGSLYSVNYDQILLATPTIKLSSRVGVGVTSEAFKGDIDPILPVEANVLFGRSKHLFETGLGVVAAFGMEETAESFGQSVENNTTTDIHGTTIEDSNTTIINQYTPEKEYTSLLMLGRIGYRYQNTKDGGLFFRASITPIVNAYSKTTGLNPRIGGNISIGYTFKYKTNTVPVLFYN